MGYKRKSHVLGEKDIHSEKSYPNETEIRVPTTPNVGEGSSSGFTTKRQNMIRQKLCHDVTSECHITTTSAPTRGRKQPRTTLTRSSAFVSQTQPSSSTSHVNTTPVATSPASSKLKTYINFYY